MSTYTWLVCSVERPRVTATRDGQNSRERTATGGGPQKHYQEPSVGRIEYVENMLFTVKVDIYYW